MTGRPDRAAPKTRAEMLHELGERLLKRRNQMGITQRRAAELVGCPELDYSRYERGVNFPPPPVLVSIGDKFNLSLDFLIAGRAVAGLRDVRLLKLLRELDKQPPDRIEQVVRIVSAALGIERRSAG